MGKGVPSGKKKRIATVYRKVVTAAKAQRPVLKSSTLTPITDPYAQRRMRASLTLFNRTAFMTNPLLTPFSLPPFSKILPEHVVPAVTEALGNCRAAVESV